MQIKRDLTNKSSPMKTTIVCGSIKKHGYKALKGKKKLTFEMDSAVVW